MKRRPIQHKHGSICCQVRSGPCSKRYFTKVNKKSEILTNLQCGADGGAAAHEGDGPDGVHDARRRQERLQGHPGHLQRREGQGKLLVLIRGLVRVGYCNPNKMVDALFIPRLM